MSCSVCIVCLSGDRRIKYIEDMELRDTYENLTRVKMCGGGGLCYVCVAQLQRCRGFADTARRAHRILTHIADKGLEATKETLTMLNIETVERLSVSNPPSAYTTNVHEGSDALETEPSSQLEVILQEEEATFELPETEEAEPLKAKDASREAFAGRGLLARAQETHHFCDVCNTGFSDRAYFERHVLTHAEKTYSCERCPKTFKLKRSLTRHSLTHGDRAPLACPACLKRFPERRSLADHRRKPCFSKSYACDVCARLLNNLFNLRKHRATHAAAEAEAEGGGLACGECGKGFSSAEVLRVHRRTHTRPHACAEAGCGRTFAQRCQLTLHARVHSGERPFACGECGKGFAMMNTLKLHRQTHTGDKPFPCPEPACRKAYHTKINLKVHMRTHAPPDPPAADRPASS